MVELLTDEAGLNRAVEILQADECVALPTETVYGLAADAASETAVAGIFASKGRPSDHPLIVHISGFDQLESWATNIPTSAKLLAEAFWPGPLTLLLEKASHVSKVVTGGHETIAMRAPGHPLFHQVLKVSGLGLAAPSANRYKKLSPTSAAQVISGMAGRIPAVLDGGPCEFGLESTIIDLTSDQPTIVRSGPIAREALEAVLGCDVLLPKQHNVAVPGNVEAHYQPNARLKKLDVDGLVTYAKNSSSACMVFSNAAKEALQGLGIDASRVRKLSAEPGPYGHDLYRTLFELDQAGFEEILVEQTPDSEAWAAVNDRLNRASS